MENIPLKKKHNTKIFREGLITVVRLYSTDILRYDAATKRLVLNTGGWETMTTRRRMREALSEILGLGYNVNVYSNKGISVLNLRGIEYPFVEGKLEIDIKKEAI